MAEMRQVVDYIRAGGVEGGPNWTVRMLGLPEAVHTVVQVLEGLRIAEYSGSNTEEIGGPAARPQSCMLAHSCCSQRPSAAELVVGKAVEPDTVLDYMADES
jgi:hypothetical protein